MILRVMMVDSNYNDRRDIDSKVKWVENDFELVEKQITVKKLYLFFPMYHPCDTHRNPYAKMDGITFIEMPKKDGRHKIYHCQQLR